jgi:hypothetical protein
LKISQIDCAFSSPSENDIRRRTGPPIVRHTLAAIEAPIFLRGPIALISPRLKIGFRPVRQEYAPAGEKAERAASKLAAVPVVIPRAEIPDKTRIHTAIAARRWDCRRIA